MIENSAVLSIAGSDPCGGAGIQADLKTFSALGVYGTTVVTAVTAQNLSSFDALQPVKPSVVKQQLRAVLKEFPIKAIKTGMLASDGIIRAVASVLKDYPHIPIVVDPVFVSTSGGTLLKDNALESLQKKLFPMAALITPNISEAAVLCGRPIHTHKDAKQALEELYQRFNIPVLLKGGHLPGLAIDRLRCSMGTIGLETEFVEGVNSHGSGCTMSAAIVAWLAKEKLLPECVALAKVFIIRSLRQALSLTPDIRVINHFTD
ncbi:MAG: bifunctional hydroxymethylpyrimidine kinase/phosphomethylpyrimidine kinase [bacterium]|nr:bifunctional hydroxymethylpyrimidine kinase/phosphomethylpyrimidine kinase [bacterium]